MGRPEDPEKAREEQFNELPLAIRQTVAQARNRRAEMLEFRDAYLGKSAEFKTLVRRLYNVDKLSKNKIALLLGLTWDRIAGIIREGR